MLQNIEEKDNEIAALNEAILEVDKDNYRCVCCNTILKNKTNKKRVRTYFEKNIAKIEKNKNKISFSILQNNQKIQNYKEQLTAFEDKLKENNMIKEENFLIYHKKPIEILKLEAERDSALNKLEEENKKLENNPIIKDNKYKDLKDRIQKYELSLENLKKIKEQKDNFPEKYQAHRQLKQELIELYQLLLKYKKFLEIYFKIYQQRANIFFGNNIKFIFFDFNDIELIKKIEIYYNNIEYKNLDKQGKIEFEKIFEEKISSFY